jgi:hypothetical protein
MVHVRVEAHAVASIKDVQQSWVSTKANGFAHGKSMTLAKYSHQVACVRLHVYEGVCACGFNHCNPAAQCLRLIRRAKL